MIYLGIIYIYITGDFHSKLSNDLNMLCFDPVSVSGAQPTAGYCAAEKGEAQETLKRNVWVT